MAGKHDGFGLNYIDPSTIYGAESYAEGVSQSAIDQAWDGVSNDLYRTYNSFSGVDIQAAIWIPPTRNRPQGTYKLWSEIQTITISSERPAGPVRVLGMATPRDYIRGVRTIAGSMIFTTIDRDVFADVLQNSDREAPADHPIYVDCIPPFHVVLTARNELGSAAGLTILDCTLTNMGQTYSIDDLMLETTYTYVARYVTPFMNQKGWRAGLAKAISKQNTGVERLSDRNPKRNPQRVQEPMADNDDDPLGDTSFWHRQ